MFAVQPVVFDRSAFLIRLSDPELGSIGSAWSLVSSDCDCAMARTAARLAFAAAAEALTTCPMSVVTWTRPCRRHNDVGGDVRNE